MTTRYELRTLGRRKGSIPSTSETFDVCSASPARQGDHHRRPISRRSPHHVHPTTKMSAVLAGPCLPYGGWPKPKRHPLRCACLRAERPVARPQPRNKNVCKSKRDMKALGININSWEHLAADRTSWRSTLQKQLQTGEKKLSAAAAEKRARRKEISANRPESTHRCDLCCRDCHSRIGLHSHNRRCSGRADSLDL